MLYGGFSLTADQVISFNYVPQIPLSLLGFTVAGG